MEPVSSIRPVVPVSGQQTGSGTERAGSALNNGDGAAPATTAETVRPVTQATGSSRAMLDLPDMSGQTDHAQARVEAAQRAYMMAVRAAGLNPMDNPVP